MNVLWTILMIAGICAMLIVSPDGAINSMIAGANDAVTLAMTLLASYALWLGLFNLAGKSGIGNFLKKILQAPVDFLFPGSSDEAKGFLSGNIAANFLGLGNAATPLGINAASALDDGSGKANANMIMLLVLSSTSLQLLPSTVIGLRAAKGSAAPASFLLSCIIATVVSTITGVILVKIASNAEKAILRRKARRSSEKKRSGKAEFCDLRAEKESKS